MSTIAISHKDLDALGCSIDDDANERTIKRIQILLQANVDDKLVAIMAARLDASIINLESLKERLHWIAFAGSTGRQLQLDGKPLAWVSGLVSQVIDGRLHLFIDVRALDADTGAVMRFH